VESGIFEPEEVNFDTDLLDGDFLLEIMFGEFEKKPHLGDDEVV
jgi:hypothetical protein